MHECTRSARPWRAAVLLLAVCAVFLKPASAWALEVLPPIGEAPDEGGLWLTPQEFRETSLLPEPPPVGVEVAPLPATTTVLDEIRTNLAPPARQSTQPEDFSNGCQPPRSWRTIDVPKTVSALREQVGPQMRVDRHGPFLVASDLSEDEHRRLLDGVLPCCLECLSGSLFRGAPDDTITIYTFRDDSTYVAGLARLFGMDPISPYGHYGHSRRYIVVNYGTGPGTLVHELTHSLMATDFPEAPIWISEGIASLYEQCRVEDGRLRGEENWRLPELQDALRRERVPSLASVFSMRPRVFRMQSESLHYAVSRYFCFYLEEKGLLQKVYHAFRDGVSADPSGVRFIQEAFGKSMFEVESDWHAWLRTRSWSGRVR